jgi:hypothetical protein
MILVFVLQYFTEFLHSFYDSFGFVVNIFNFCVHLSAYCLTKVRVLIQCLSWSFDCINIIVNRFFYDSNIDAFNIDRRCCSVRFSESVCVGSSGSIKE